MARSRQCSTSCAPCADRNGSRSRSAWPTASRTMSVLIEGSSRPRCASTPKGTRWCSPPTGWFTLCLAPIPTCAGCCNGRSTRSRSGTAPTSRSRFAACCARHCVTGHSRAAQVAALFSMHSRTLSRRLDAFGVNFQALVDEGRFEIARQMLGDSAMDVRQIALLLGYADPSAFTRAFRRWSGSTPGRWRASAAPPVATELDPGEVAVQRARRAGRRHARAHTAVASGRAGRTLCRSCRIRRANRTSRLPAGKAFDRTTPPRWRIVA